MGREVWGKCGGCWCLVGGELSLQEPVFPERDEARSLWQGMGEGSVGKSVVRKSCRSHSCTCLAALRSIAVHRTRAAYDSMLFREALKVWVVWGIGGTCGGVLGWDDS